MQEPNAKITWLNNVFIVAIIFLTLLSLTFNLIQNIFESLSGRGSVIEYVLLLAYVLPALIVWGLLRNIRWVYAVAGIWCAISASFILFTILFSPVGGAIWLMSGQCALLVMLSIMAFFLWKKIKEINILNK